MTGRAFKLKVAAVQMECRNGDMQGNLDKALRFVEKAAAKRARLIVLPEFLAAGYIFTPELWDSGEPREGPTVRWLRKHSKRLGVYLGTSYLEAEGEDFYNTFVMTAPDGTEAGRVRKETPAAFEAYFFREHRNPHIIQTDFGTVGVGICYETQRSFLPPLMRRGNVDIMLMPHSAPSASPSFLYPRGAVEWTDRNMKSLAPYYARLLGVPAVMVNKSGPWVSPAPGLPFLRQVSSFHGHTAIADSDGTLKAQMGDEEGLIVEEVTMDPVRKKELVPNPRGRWARPEPWAKNLFAYPETMGRISYRLSRARKAKAKEISGRPD